MTIPPVKRNRLVFALTVDHLEEAARRQDVSPTEFSASKNSRNACLGVIRSAADRDPLSGRRDVPRSNERLQVKDEIQTMRCSTSVSGSSTTDHALARAAFRQALESSSVSAGQDSAAAA